MSLRLRLTLAFALMLVLCIAGFGAILFVAMQRALEAEMDRRLVVRASQVQLTIWPGVSSLAAEDITSARLDLSPLAALNAPTLYVQVLNRDGSVVARSANLQGAELPVEPGGLQQALRGERAFTDVFVEDDHPVRILNIPIPIERGIVGVLQVGQSRQPLRDTMDDLGRLLAVLGAAAVGFAGFVGWSVANGAIRPLRTMAERAAAIAEEGDFHRRVGPAAGRDEIGQLGRTVDHLLETVDETLRRHREFVADTSHELRNPLLAIRANLELLTRVEEPEAKAECIAEASSQIERMSRLVQDLLLLAQAEADQVLDRRVVDLGPLVERVAHEARQRAAERAVHVELGDPVEVFVDEGRLEQVLTNLVDNALQHTRTDGRIELSIEREDGWARIQVTDDGEGIAPEHLPYVFERFYRGSGAVSGGEAQSGLGLGLAIVKHLTEAHGGRVSVESAPGAGATFSVWLKARPRAAPRR